MVAAFSRVFKDYQIIWKVGVTALSLGYIVWYLLTHGDDWAWPRISWKEIGWILLAIAWMPVNLGIEARKWQVLLEINHSIPFQKLFKGVFSGISLGIFTPNRIGEYAGRLMFLPREIRWEGGVFTWIGRQAQMVITLFLGGLIIEWILYTGLDLGSLASKYLIPIRWIVWGMFTIQLSFLVVHRHILRWIPLPGSWKLRQNLVEAGKVLNTERLFRVITWSLIRYATFTLQYICLLYAFGYEGSYLWAGVMVVLVFLIKSLAPIASFAELGIRETVALTIMGLWGVSSSVALTSALALYIVNLVIPALLGLWWMYLHKFK